MEPDDDQSLMNAIARGQNSQALETLFQRHQRACSGLALALTGRWDFAEEAVQEGMLRVWRAAKRYQPREGSTVRAWLLQVVAREGLRLLRKRQKADKSMAAGILKRRGVAEEFGEGETALEKQEALSALRTTLLKLSASDRQLVALAFGAGMAHHEIAKELALSRWAVPRRLEQVLNVLRANLKRTGFAAALPLAHPGELGAAIHSGLGLEPTPDLAARVISRIAEEGTEPYATPWNQPKAWGSGGVAWLVGVLVAGVVAGGVAGGVAWWQAGESTPSVESKAFAAPAALQGRWDFRRGPDPALKLFGGTWRWRDEGAAGSGMDITSPGLPAVLLPQRIPAGPVLVTLKFRNVRSGLVYWGGKWTDGKRLFSCRRWAGRGRKEIGNEFFQVQLYFIGRHVIQVSAGGAVSSLVEYDREYPGDHLIVSFKRPLLQEIELRTLLPEEIPEPLREPGKLKQGMQFEGQIEEQPLPGVLPEQPQPLRRRWDFERAPALLDTIDNHFGAWRHLPAGGPDGSGCMEIDVRQGRFEATFDLLAERVPLLLSFQCSFPQASYDSHFAQWAGKENSAPLALFAHMGREPAHGPGQWFDIRYFVTADCVSCWSGDQHLALAIRPSTKYSTLCWQMGLVPGAKGGLVRIDNLEIRGIPQKDLPDLAPFLAAWEKIAPRHRAGILPVPELKSAYADRPVQVMILPSSRTVPLEISPISER